MIINITPWNAGFVALALVATFAVVRYCRHLCPHPGCNRHTKKTYRLFPLHNLPQKPGMKLYLSYKFRICSKGDVTVSYKTVELSTEQVAAKPIHESDWNSGAELCERARIPNPFVAPPKFFVEHYEYTLPKPFSKSSRGDVEMTIVAAPHN